MNGRERGDTKDHPLSQWFTTFSEADELLKLAASRQQVRIVLSVEHIDFSEAIRIYLGVLDWHTLKDGYLIFKCYTFWVEWLGYRKDARPSLCY